MKYTFVCSYAHGSIAVVKKLRFLGFLHSRAKAPQKAVLGLPGLKWPVLCTNASYTRSCYQNFVLVTSTHFFGVMVVLGRTLKNQ